MKTEKYAVIFASIACLLMVCSVSVSYQSALLLLATILISFITAILFLVAKCKAKGFIWLANSLMWIVISAQHLS